MKSRKRRTLKERISALESQIRPPSPAYDPYLLDERELGRFIELYEKGAEVTPTEFDELEVLKAKASGYQVDLVRLVREFGALDERREAARAAGDEALHSALHAELCRRALARRASPTWGPSPWQIGDVPRFFSSGRSLTDTTWCVADELPGAAERLREPAR